MRHRMLVGVAALGLLIGVAAGPVSAAQDHSVPGTPGAPNCEGQTTAYFAQVGQEFGLQGIGHLANDFDLKAQDIKAIIKAWCNP
jgi:hypothetical protein